MSRTRGRDRTRLRSAPDRCPPPRDNIGFCGEIQDVKNDGWTTTARRAVRRGARPRMGAQRATTTTTMTTIIIDRVQLFMPFSLIIIYTKRYNNIFSRDSVVPLYSALRCPRRALSDLSPSDRPWTSRDGLASRDVGNALPPRVRYNARRITPYGYYISYYYYFFLFLVFFSRFYSDRRLTSILRVCPSAVERRPSDIFGDVLSAQSSGGHGAAVDRRMPGMPRDPRCGHGRRRTAAPVRGRSASVPITVLEGGRGVFKLEHLGLSSSH